MTVGVRPTPAQIDRGILEVAAGLFAQHGYARTSLQQLADAAGYSKTGLLHRFASKAQLHATVVAVISEEIERVVADVEPLPPGRRRTVTALERLTAAALEHPGLVRFFLAACGPGTLDVQVEELHALGERFLAALGVDDTDPERRVRVVLALVLLAHAAADPPADLGDRLGPLVVELASGVVGPDG